MYLALNGYTIANKVSLKICIEQRNGTPKNTWIFSYTVTENTPWRMLTPAQYTLSGNIDKYYALRIINILYDSILSRFKYQ